MFSADKFICFQQVVDKEWDKYRVAFVITGKPHYVEEDDKTINTKVSYRSYHFKIFTVLFFRNSEAFLFMELSHNNSPAVVLG